MRNLNYSKFSIALKNYRYKISRIKNIPPSFILNDEDIASLIKILPTTIEELSNSNILSDITIKYYGSDIISIINSIIDKNNINISEWRGPNSPTNDEIQNTIDTNYIINSLMNGYDPFTKERISGVSTKTMLALKNAYSKSDIEIKTTTIKENKVQKEIGGEKTKATKPATIIEQKKEITVSKSNNSASRNSYLSPELREKYHYGPSPYKYTEHKYTERIKVGDTVKIQNTVNKKIWIVTILPVYETYEPEFVYGRPSDLNYRTVYHTEANPDENSISERSPLAKAILGSHVGQTFEYAVKNKLYKGIILEKISK